MRDRNLDFRIRISNSLEGIGLDLGPWHQPFPMNNATSYLVDRYTPSEMLEVFDEFSSDMNLDIRSDYICNFDLEYLDQFESNKYDFVIASHLLEHLAQPFLFLKEIHRILKLGSDVIIALPDKRRTFDKSRELLSIEHFKAEVSLGKRIADDDHLDDYIKSVLNLNPNDAKLRKRELERSFHVHVFEDVYFLDILWEMCNFMHISFDLIDGAPTTDKNSVYEEFLLVLKKSEMLPNKKDFLNKWKNLSSK